MITVEQAIAITLASIVIIVVPGPSVMFIVGRALSYGRANALASVAGNTLGCYLVCVLISLGLGPLIERSELLFQGIRWAGVLFLIFLGVQAIRHAGPIPGVDDVAGADEDASEAGSSRSRQPVRGSKLKVRNESLLAATRTGVIVGLTNPKSFIMFMVIVPQFIAPNGGNTTVQLLVLGLVPVAIGLTTDTAWALIAGKARNWLASSPRRMTNIGRIGGISIIGVGLSVAFSGNH